MKTKEIALIWRKLAPSFQGLGLVIKGKFVFISPVNDFVRGVYFEGAFDPACFYLRALFMSLFLPQEEIHFLHGDRIGNPIDWTVENPHLVENLREVIEREAIPFLETVSTFPGVLECVKNEVERGGSRYNSHHLEELAYLYVKNGERSKALESLGRLKHDLKNETTPWVVDQRNRAQLIETKLLESPEAALRQFEEWKKQTVINLGLEKYVASK